MSETPAPIPVPIPAPAPPPLPSVLADTGVWSSGDAARWSHARPAPWARPLWSVLALLITVVWAIAAAPDPPCTDAAPCGADWLGMTETGLAVGLLYWFARLPEVTLVAAPVLAAIVARLELPDAGPDSLAANLCVLAALGLGWAAAAERLAARRRQRDLAEAAATARHPVPGPLAPLRRGLILMGAGLALLAVAAFSAAEGLAGVHDDRRHADRAVLIAAKVVGRDDESVRVRTDDGRLLRLDSLYPEDYRPGSEPAVLEDDAWRRLAAEPYDAIGPQLGLLAAGLPGLSLLVTGLLARRRAAALRRGPVPVLRVLERMDRDGLLWIYAGDDTAARRPVLTADVVAEVPHEDEHGRVRPGGEEQLNPRGPVRRGGEEELVPAFPLSREVVMFGAPRDGGELLLVTTLRDGGSAVVRTSGPVRLPRPGRGPEADPETEARAAAGGVAAAVPATLITTGRPLSWGPGHLGRAVGAALALVAIVGAAVNARTLVTDGVDVKAALYVLFLLSWLATAAQLLNWRVIADSSGLWLSGGWKVRHLPWEQLRSVRYTKDGGVEIGMPDSDHWRLPGLGMPKLERRFGRNPSYVRVTEEVAALRDHPELRPTEAVSGRGRGVPLGPALLVLAVAVALAWAFH
ncbi:hypothetical protein ACFYXJ_26455 [Streptomyces sp. NPDC002667]|uniref:hypothetical protein n=1 Tax=Streptomyces sp. NPDC002667 TaxID=3364657 RepID=UPI0036CF598A